MGIDRVFSESPRELIDGEKKCFLVIPPDSKCIKLRVEDCTRFSHIELGAARVDLGSCPQEDGFLVVNLPSNARFSQFVLNDEYLSGCSKKKFIVGKKKTEDGSSEFEDRIEVDVSVTDVSSLDGETFRGESFLTYNIAMMPQIIITPKN